MNKTLFAAALAALLLSACVLAPVGRGPEVGVSIGIGVPALPVIVELNADRYYAQGGYTYFYDNDRWRYSQSRSGPWVELPRSHYPKETYFRDRGDRRDRRDRDDRDDRRDRRDDPGPGRGR